MPGAFNLGLILRQIVGVGKPRRPQGSSGAILSLIFAAAALGFGRFVARGGDSGPPRFAEPRLQCFRYVQVAA
jgi:hypothetical protein